MERERARRTMLVMLVILAVACMNLAQPGPPTLSLELRTPHLQFSVKL